MAALNGTRWTAGMKPDADHTLSDVEADAAGLTVPTRDPKRFRTCSPAVRPVTP